MSKSEIQLANGRVQSLAVFLVGTIVRLAVVVAFAVLALTLMSNPSSAGVRGNLGYQLDAMPDWNRFPYLSQMLKDSGVDCTVNQIFDNGTLMGAEFITVGCEGDKALILRTDSYPTEAFSCFDPSLPKGLGCFEPLPYDERNSI